MFATIDSRIPVCRETFISLNRKKVARAGLRIEFPVRTVEKGTVSEYLCVPKGEAQEQEGYIKRCPTAPTVTAFGVPPIRQVWTHGECHGLECKKGKEKAEMAPE